MGAGELCEAQVRETWWRESSIKLLIFRRNSLEINVCLGIVQVGDHQNK
jgi:hypothetical protein